MRVALWMLSIKYLEKSSEIEETSELIPPMLRIAVQALFKTKPKSLCRDDSYWEISEMSYLSIRLK